MRFSRYVAAFALLLAGCALRPRYNDFVTAKTEGKELTFVVVNTANNQPVPGAKVEVSELKNRIITTTGADGTFKLPVEKKYADENPIFVVTLPKDVVQYRVEVAKLVAPPVMPVVPAEVPAALDAGTP